MIDSGVDNVVCVLIEHGRQNLRVLTVDLRRLSLAKIVQVELTIVAATVRGNKIRDRKIEIENLGQNIIDLSFVSLPADYSRIFRARITRVHHAGMADQLLDSSADPQIPSAHRLVRAARVQFTAVGRVVNVRYGALMTGQNRVVLAVVIHVPKNC